MKLKEIRKKHARTQSDCADILGITQVAYSQYELGKRKIPVSMLEKLADYFNVSCDHLLGRDRETTA